jgi:HD-like signal output (HDOD) protein
MNARVLETIKKSAAVPSMPQIVLRFLEIMQDPDFDYAELVRVLSTDPGTVSEILRLANSALFGVRNKVVSPRHALTLLGPKRTRSLLLGRYLVDSVSKKKVAGLDMAYFWRRSLATSVVASHFGEKVLPRQRDEAFIGALLADIGVPILAEAMPEQYGDIVTRYAPLAEPITPDMELEAVQVTHAQVSAMVLAHWTLPDTVTAAVNLHQSGHPGEGAVGTVARVLNAADRIGRLLCEVPSIETIAEVCEQATGFIGIDQAVLLQLLPTIEADIEELADALRIDVLRSQVYALVAKTIQDRLTPATAL